MKTEIHITGQLAGNVLLKNAISCYEVRERAFHSYILSFATKQEAKKALWEAFKFLRNNLDLRERKGNSGLRYNKFGKLYWDASKAIII